MKLTPIILSLLLVTTVLGGEFKTFTFGGRSNKIYIPNVTSSPIPLYVMLHGCTQNPTDFATGTKMNTFADQYNFLVLYPEQPSSANSNKCWNWFEPAHQKRGSGEPNLIATMIDEVKKQYKVDNARVYVGGLSAGAAFSVIMGVTYPDYFAAVAVGAGLEWKAATSTISALIAMSSGGPNPVLQGDDAYNTMSSRAKTLGILVIHGTSDATVAPINAEQIVKQFARTTDKVIGKGTANGVFTDIPTSSQDGTVPGGRAFTIKSYDDPTTGKTLMKWVQVKSMGHAWSGGSSSGTYTDPKGPDASQIMIDFFSTFPSGGVTTTTTTTTTTTGPVTTGSVTTGMPLDKSLILYAVASESGFVGMTVLDGYSVDEAKIGSKAGYINDAYRTILTFDTGAIPIKMNTTRAILKIYRKSLTGNVNQISVDFKDGSFGTTGALKQSDYYASATVAKAVTLYPPTQDGQFSEVELPQTVVKSIANKGPNSRVSFRLRDPSTTVSANANTLWIYGGEAEVPRFAASLTIFFA